MIEFIRKLLAGAAITLIVCVGTFTLLLAICSIIPFFSWLFNLGV